MANPATTKYRAMLFGSSANTEPVSVKVAQRGMFGNGRPIHRQTPQRRLGTVRLSFCNLYFGYPVGLHTGPANHRCTAVDPVTLSHAQGIEPAEFREFVKTVPFRSGRDTTRSERTGSRVVSRFGVNWWAWIDSNYRPPLYQSGALTG